MCANRGHEVRECYRCGGEFKVFNSDAANGAGKYCSYDCANEAKSRREDVLAVLPNTVYGIAKALGIDRRAAAGALRRMCNRGDVHPSGFTDDQSREVKVGQATHTLVYSAGPCLDPEMPINNLKLCISRFYDLCTLAAMPGTLNELIATTGIGATTVTKRVAKLRAAGLIHISGWKRPKQGSFTAVHAAGPGTDAPCKLKPIPRSVKDKRYFAKAKREGRIEEIRAKHRNRVAVSKKIKVGDPLINALFGAPKERKVA